jgi:hypothetical protein
MELALGWLLVVVGGLLVEKCLDSAVCGCLFFWAGLAWKGMGREAGFSATLLAMSLRAASVEMTGFG